MELAQLGRAKRHGEYLTPLRHSHLDNPEGLIGCHPPHPLKPGVHLRAPARLKPREVRGRILRSSSNATGPPGPGSDRQRRWCATSGLRNRRPGVSRGDLGPRGPRRAPVHGCRRPSPQTLYSPCGPWPIATQDPTRSRRIRPGPLRPLLWGARFGRRLGISPQGYPGTLPRMVPLLERCPLCGTGSTLPLQSRLDGRCRLAQRPSSRLALSDPLRTLRMNRRRHAR